MNVRVVGGHKGLVSVFRGPLLFGLQIGEKVEKIRGEGARSDYAISPTTPWNYGLSFDPANLANSFRVVKHAVPAMPFDGSKPAVEIRVKARRLPDWKLVDNSAGPVHGAPQESQEPLEEVVLVPFGVTRLRIAAFPVVK